MLASKLGRPLPIWEWALTQHRHFEYNNLNEQSSVDQLGVRICRHFPPPPPSDTHTDARNHRPVTMFCLFFAGHHSSEDTRMTIVYVGRTQVQQQRVRIGTGPVAPFFLCHFSPSALTMPISVAKRHQEYIHVQNHILFRYVEPMRIDGFSICQIQIQL